MGLAFGLWWAPWVDGFGGGCSTGSWVACSSRSWVSCRIGESMWRFGKSSVVSGLSSSRSGLLPLNGGRGAPKTSNSTQHTFISLAPRRGDARGIKRNKGKMTRCLSTKCGEAVVNATTRELKGRGVASHTFIWILLPFFCISFSPVKILALTRKFTSFGQS